MLRRRWQSTCYVYTDTMAVLWSSPCVCFYIALCVFSRSSNLVAMGKQQKQRLPRSKVQGRTSKAKAVEGPRSKVQGTKAKKRGDDTVIYTRVSSRKQADKTGFSRQAAACTRIAKTKNIKKEVISGSLPFNMRDESARAVSRSTVAGEEAYMASRRNGVQIVSSDMPDLFTHTTPAPGKHLCGESCSRCKSSKRM